MWSTMAVEAVYSGIDVRTVAVVSTVAFEGTKHK